MTIHHLDRAFVHVDRTLVEAEPAVVRQQLRDLASLVRDRDDLRIEDWPDDGLRETGATFWAVHCTATAGHSVGYTLTAQEPNLLELRSRSDLYEATHRVVLAPDVGSGCEVAWSVTLEDDRPVTRALVLDAALLGRATLRGLTDGSPFVIGADRAALA